MSDSKIPRIASAFVLAAITAATAQADDFSNLLGVYAGGSVGWARIDQNHGNGDPWSHDRVGWAATVGVKPIPFLGAELEYIDFGSARSGSDPLLGSATVDDKAAALFAVGYLPLPIPFLQPFAKLGWGYIWERDHFFYGDSQNGFSSFAHNDHESGLAYGGGVQFHISKLSIRAQYERIDGTHGSGYYGGVGGKPSLASVGATWTF